MAARQPRSGPIDPEYNATSSQSLTHILRFNQHVLIDTTPLPDHIPKVKEIGSSSAPLMSASFFVGARCKPYNDDYMVCKTESHGKGELDCMREGRKVTRCAASVCVLSPGSFDRFVGD